MRGWNRSHSLRHRVLAGLFLVTFVYWSSVAVLAVRFNLKEAHELYDIHLSHTGVALLRLVSEREEVNTPITELNSASTVDQLYKRWPDFPERIAIGKGLTQEDIVPLSSFSRVADPEVVARNVEHGRTMRFQLWREGQLIFKSTNAPTTPITVLQGFSTGTDASAIAWRNYSVWDVNHELLAMVAEPEELRLDLVRNTAIRHVNPFVLGAPVFILLLWLSVRAGLKPLTDLSKAIANSEPDSLAPIEVEGSPRELKPIVNALNQLIERMKQSIEAERRFNSNAAHELNTPLAAVQAHLYVARQSKSEAERQQALNQAQAATERGIRVISQMLILARLGQQDAASDMVNLNLYDIVQDVCAEVMPLAMRHVQTLEILTQPGSMAVKGLADLLHQLIGNLVDNAMRYSPPHSQILLELAPAMNGLRLTVSDDGPGIPEEKRAEVFNRFFRLADRSVSGTGLGLSICRKIADMHRAQISLSAGPDGKGLSVHVDFPTAA